ncbi:MAG: CPBP family intramembrane glutamic endopeptidase [Gammaproteobacteria bacterium]
MTNPDKTPHEGRLQRRASGSGGYVNSFRQVLKRHGLTMGSVALLGLFLPDAWDRLDAALTPLLHSPLKYIAAAGGLIIFFRLYQRRRNPQANSRHTLWLGYLLFISVVEEMAFRLFLPNELTQALPFFAAVVLSNALFAVIHYITLRWHWWNCLFVFAGGLGFSHMLYQSGDLAMVILAHWFFTFLNTPAPPSSRPAAHPDPESLP